MSKLAIKNVKRVTSEGEVESLHFEDGLNLIIGKPNTGKTIWLKLIDHCLGDNSSIEKALSEDADLLDKYIAIQIDLVINGVNYNLERDWTKPGQKTKTLIDGEPYDADEFSEFMLNKLQFPVLKIPKGNPYLNTWNSLSFRSLFRHIYRQERFWSEIADKQPPADQFACISLFLGFAELLFPQELSEITAQYKLLSNLETKREQYTTILDKITRELTSEDDGGELSYATLLEVDALSEKYVKKTRELNEQREAVIKESLDKSKLTSSRLLISDITQRRQSLVKRLIDKQNEISSFIQKIKEINDLQFRITNEINRLKRADGSSILSDLKITHCPACDQSVESLPKDEEDSCFLCHQVIPKNDSYDGRIELEIKQLEIEQKEINLLRIDTQKAIESLSERISNIEKSIRQIDQQIAPLKNSLSVLTNEQLSIIDVKRGQLNEKIENLLRIRSNIVEKNEIAKTIDEANKKIEVAERKAETLIYNIPFAEISQDLEEGMNSYLSSINRSAPGVWNQGRVQCTISQKGINFYVGNKGWMALSATLKAYFLLSYHYGLLSLSNTKNYKYPKFLIIDFPMQFDKESVSTSTLNYMIKPFRELAKDKSCQIMIAGRNFNMDEDDVNSIYLNKVYKY